MQMRVISERVRSDDFHLIIAERDVHQKCQIAKREAVQLMNVSVLDVYRA